MIAVLLLLLAQRPDPVLTPGQIRPLTMQQVCHTRWGLDRRHVTLTMKRQVFADYGIPWSEHAKYEVDHLVSRELGGADDTSNLWPQPWTGPWNAHLKDRLENELHRRVCSGRMPLADAQRLIAQDWIALYQRTITGYLGTGTR